MKRDGTEHPLDLSRREPANGEAELARGKAALERLLLRTYLNDLRSDSWRVRKKGARGLGALGRAAGDAVSELRSLLSDPDPRVKGAAREALQAIERVAGADVTARV